MRTTQKLPPEGGSYGRGGYRHASYNEPPPRDKSSRAGPAADPGPPAGPVDHPGHGGRLLVVRLRANLRAAPPADRPHGSEPEGLPAAPPHSERPEPARAGDARHARCERALPAHRLVGAVLPHPAGSGRRPRP